MKKTLLFLLILFSFAGAQNRELELTVYNDNLALVKDVRHLRFTESGSFHFQDVSDRIILSSVSFNLLNEKGSVVILEQNYDYDLVSPEKLLEKNIDGIIEVVTSSKSYKGKLLAFRNNVITLETKNGIKIIKWEKEGQINLPSLPEGLITRPTLVWELLVKKPYNGKVEIGYLTNGISWEVNYVGTYIPEKNAMNINAWASITNQTAVTYPDAKIRLMAGDINRERSREQVMMLMRSKQKSLLAAPDFEEKEFFEYHLYNLNNRTTLKSNQQKQIAFFSAASVPVKKVFRYNAFRDETKVEVVLSFKNSKKNGLGVPMPKGIFRIYQKDEESSAFLGEDHIEHTPRKKEIALTVGKAFDLSGQRVVKSKKKVYKNSILEEIEITLENHKTDDDVIIEVIETIYATQWSIKESNFKYKKEDYNTVKFSIPVPANSKTILNYKVKKTW